VLLAFFENSVTFLKDTEGNNVEPNDDSLDSTVQAVLLQLLAAVCCSLSRNLKTHNHLGQFQQQRSRSRSFP
jgi:hypothetical protein